MKERRFLAERFPVGTYFCLEGAQDRQLWRVTDVGERVVVAIQHKPGWTDGPPYALAEHVFDEHDQAVMVPREVPA